MALPAVVAGSLSCILWDLPNWHYSLGVSYGRPQSEGWGGTHSPCLLLTPTSLPSKGLCPQRAWTPRHHQRDRLALGDCCCPVSTVMSTANSRHGSGGAAGVSCCMEHC